jgi:hemoglobin
MDAESLKIEVYKVNKEFYDRIYKDTWMAKIFRNVAQEFITSQQTDFMVGALGGPKTYSGRSPGDAHPHIFVDEEMWQVREKYLKEAFAVVNFPADLAAKWLRIDEAFKAAIIKNDVSECQGRYRTDEIIYEPNPNRKKAS